LVQHVRIAASSSARRICPLGIGIRPQSRVRAITGAVHRQQQAERSASRSRVALNDPAVVAHDLRHQGKSEATSLGFGGDEGVEQLLDEVGRNAGPAVATASSIGRLTRSRDPGTCSRTPVRKAVESTISPSTVSPPMLRRRS
jgi:hypothetical protein